MLKIRKNVELKRVRTIRFYFNDFKMANKCFEEIVDNYMDKMGITLISGQVLDIDYDDGRILDLKVFTTYNMYLHIRTKIFEIKNSFEEEGI